MDYINLDIIVQKVAGGIYQGKNFSNLFETLSISVRCSCRQNVKISKSYFFLIRSKSVSPTAPTLQDSSVFIIYLPYLFNIDVTTVDLDNLAAETCAYMTIVHPDYSKLAARILVSNLHKQTSSNFLEVSKRLKDFKDKVGRPAPMLADDVYEVIEKNTD